MDRDDALKLFAVAALMLAMVGIGVSSMPVFAKVLSVIPVGAAMLMAGEYFDRKERANS